MNILFVPVLVVTALYLLFYRTQYFKKNIKRKNPKLFFNLHVILCVLSAVLVLLHVAARLPFFLYLPLGFRITGLAMLALLIAQFAIGIRMKMKKKKPNPKLFKYHRILPGILLAVVLVHAVVLRTIYFG